LDSIDRHLCKAGVLEAASWQKALQQKEPKLYAGELARSVSQFRTHFGVTPFVSSTRNIRHDIRNAMPIPDNSINIFQSEDVFEHIPYEDIPAIFEEIWRVLKPGGLFRLSVPDYRCPVMLDRSIKDEAGRPIFDPGGGGALRDGRVVDGGHVWFPVYETVQALFDMSSFAAKGHVSYLHYTGPGGKIVLNPIDYSLGFIMRTPDHDDRVMSPPQALSIVVDAVKSAENE
jgi:SAM-dependent methyltransferase